MSNFISQHKRTRLNGDYRAAHVDEEVTVYGWVQSYRDHGGVIFVDVRDRSGIVQLRFEPWVTDGASHKLADTLRTEWVIGARGKVISRGENINSKIPTGEIEVLCDTLEVLSESPTPPFEIKDDLDTSEALRLKYRYLDLRRTSMSRNFQLRSKVYQQTRNYFADHGFIEVETPILANSTPEGARDYLVPSRVHPGSFYALPQSPQQFKQLLMMSGMDRYMQICRCFRDEDLRADRQPEFTQLDLEMSFVSVEDIRDLLDGYIRGVWKNVLDIEVPTPVPTITYAEAMDKYGIDKPDLRFGLPLTDLTETLTGRVEFRIFKGALDAGGIVKALYLPNGKVFSRKDLDKVLPAEAAPFGAKGIAWARVQPGGAWSGPVAKGVDDALRADLNTALGAEEGGLILFSADKPSVVNAALARIRGVAAERLG
ncbi:MAG: aspartate--tRNA ligase, partial [Myxococcales bacterium]|nr:aspartate--tRNA ligase [Myxococcales bacterium]